MPTGKPVKTYRETMLAIWEKQDTTPLETLLKGDNERLRDHRRWALICEVNAGYEGCPETRAELQKMQAYHTAYADFVELEIGILLEVLEARWHAGADDGGDTQEKAADEAEPEREGWQGSVPAMVPVTPREN